ncbi:uncharacterized protein EAF02_007249 [Botrytis sinoallii]|uniref:uncharacterized protein n=1 Tax=Botrytis sinoallii TaxID=1463999 RepID=UPI001900CB02|nr:uncharacterized protein EAF02_007249 [Botrytis sinoallii]KAF7880403.1 hypothetical protein EAF02_007249 [Botrytis sinoallii]
MASNTLPLFNSPCTSPTISTKFSKGSTFATNSSTPTSRKVSQYRESFVQWRPWQTSKPTTDEDLRKPHVRSLSEHQKSYRSLSIFLDSDENFKIYRRFGYLHSRLLLRKQDEIRRLEMELDELDDLDEAEDAPDKRRARSRNADIAAERKELAEDPTLRTRTIVLDEIEANLAAYDELLLRSQHVNAMNRPADSDYRSVERYIFDKKPLVDEEQGFIYEKNDLITLREGREGAYLDTMTERFLQIFHCAFLQSIFCTTEDREKTTDPNLHFYSKSRKDIFVTSLLVLMLLLLLILPVFLLYRLTEHHNLDVTYTVSIGVLLIFTLLFSAVLSLFTQAKRHEIFGAAAGYCAVLVVFISNIPNAN